MTSNAPTAIVNSPQTIPSIGSKRFVKAISESNELVNIILRTHLLCEYYLDQILVAKISRGDSLIDDSRTTFAYKIQLIKAFNFLENSQAYLLDSAAGLNKVRNNCSHTLDYSVSESDVDKIGRPQGAGYLSQKINLGDDLKKLLINTLVTLISGLDFISCKCVAEASSEKNLKSGAIVNT